jgi:hypothetical protein
MKKLLSVLAACVIWGLGAPAWAAPRQAEVPFATLVPDLAPRFKITFHRTAGVPGFRVLDTTIDSWNLAFGDRSQLRKLVADVHFFKLKSSVVDISPVIPDPPAVYTITVEVGKERHTVSWNNGRSDLQPLCAWLTDWASREPFTGRCQPTPLATRCILPDQVSVTLTGRLQMVFHGLERLADARPNDRRPSIIVSWQVVVGGKTFVVDLGASKEMGALASKLNGQMVEATGQLTGGTLSLTSLRPAAASATPRAQVEIRGLLRYSELERFPVLPVWEVTAAGQTFRLSLGSEALRQRGRELNGQRVVVRGALVNGQVIVTDLEPVPPTRC